MDPGVDQWLAEQTAIIAAKAAAESNGAAPAPTFAIERWSAFRDATDPHPRYLVDGLHPEGAVSFFAAEPKAGKTWTILYRDVCLATGHPFIGHDTHKVPVLYVGLEGMRHAIRARIGCLARGLGIDPDSDELDLLHILYKPRGFDLASERMAEWVCENAAAIGARLVTFDTMRSAAQVRESAEGAQDFAKLLRHLNPLTTSGVSVEFLHHYVKLTETRQQRAAADRMSGTGALRGHLDLGMFITKYEPAERRMRIEFELRDGAALDPVGVRIEGEGTGPNGGFTYADSARFVADDEILGEQTVRAAAKDIADWIKARSTRRAVPKEIRDQFDISDGTLRNRRTGLDMLGIEYVEAGQLSVYKAVDQ
jgi:hypothetical protein